MQIHFHDHDAEDQDLEPQGLTDAWQPDDVLLTTIGVDIGSATSHLLFSRLRLQRIANDLSARYAVVERVILHRSPIQLTAYRDDGTIDVAPLQRLIADAHDEAGLAPADIDTGAVILTGTALERRNSRAIAELFAAGEGRFVCASAGHALETMLAANGSGAVARSRRDDSTVLNLDIGGGTSKLALIRAGQIIATSAIAVGARLLAFSEDGRIVRLESAGGAIVAAAGIAAAIGTPFGTAERARVAGAMADELVRAVGGVATGSLQLLPPLPPVPDIEAIVVSGGVGELLWERGPAPGDDLGQELADAIRARRDRFAAPLVAPDHATGAIGATVVGASQFAVQLSGSTIHLSSDLSLPLRNVPVVAIGEASGGGDLATRVRDAIGRMDQQGRTGAIAVALRWHGEPDHPALRSLADGLHAGVGARRPLIVAIDGDIGLTLGRILRDEIAFTGPLAVVDGLELAELDFVDVGAILQPAGVVPVIVKSLVFPVA